MSLQIVKKMLSASQGGSILERSESPERAFLTTLYVGLGTLGCKTVNEIKRVVKEDFQQAHNVAFLAVDSDLISLRHFSVEGVGNLETEEIFELYDPTNLFPVPPEVKTWLGDVQPNPIDESGARAIRQIGRLMLCGTLKYQDLRRVLIDKINMLDGVVNIVLVSGLSGGTGSGIFVDVAYMVQKICEEYSLGCRVLGCFYTPDVYELNPGIREDLNRLKLIQSNGYAALKELDYFMSNGSNSYNAPIIYKMCLPGGETVESSKPILDEGHAFIISPSETDATVEEVVARTAKSFTYIFQCKKCEVFYNEYFLIDSLTVSSAAFCAWRASFVGVSDFLENSDDSSGIDNTDFPIFMNYKYSTLNLNSVYFPKDEIVAYCANAMFSRVIVKWRNPDLMSQENVNRCISGLKVWRIDRVYHSLMEQLEKMGYNERDLRVDKVSDSIFYPKILGTSFLGKAKGMDRTMSFAEEKAHKKILNFDNKFIICFVKSLYEEIANILFSPNFIGEYGPFFVKAVLEALCNNVDVFFAEFDRLKQECRHSVEHKRSVMMEEAAKLESSIIPAPEKIEAFIDACYEFSKALFEGLVCENLLMPVLKELSRGFKKRSRTFGIFEEVIYALENVLHTDAEVFLAADRKYFAGGRKFDFDAYNLIDSGETRNRIKCVLDDYADNPNITTSLADNLARSMSYSQVKWEECMENPEALAHEIRGCFSESLNPIANNLLEKFLVLAYSPDLISDLRALDEIWYAKDGTLESNMRESAIGRAASYILHILKNSNHLLGNTELSLMSIGAISIPDSTPHLRQAIKNLTDFDVAMLGYDCNMMTESFAVSARAPIALPFVNGIRDWAQSYYDLSANRLASAGRHLYEGSQKWDKLLPEVYGVDAENYFVENRGMQDMAIRYPERSDGQPINNDKVLYKKISAAYEYGVKCGYIYRCEEESDDSPGYRLLFIENLKECAPLIKDLLKNCEKYSDPLYFKKLLENAEGAIWKEITILNSFNGRHLVRRADKCSENGIKNIYRIIRSNMYLIKLVLGTKKIYEESGIFDVSENN